MTKALIILLVSALSIVSVVGQEYNLDELDVAKACEHLTIVAWENNPRRAALDVESEKMLADANRNTGLIEGLTVGSNINEFILTGSDRSDFFPKYYLAYRISLGEVLKNSEDKKLAKLNYDLLNIQQDNEFRSLRSEIYRKFFDLQLRNKLLRIAAEDYDEKNSQIVSVEEDFINGNVGLLEYNSVLKEFRNTEENKLKAEFEYNLAKTNLEELVGLSFKEIMEAIN